MKTKERKRNGLFGYIFRFNSLGGEGMYKAIIVEDEVPVRTAICNSTPWDKLGYELVYVASDGQDALAYIENNQVDIILTDICMPFMDGLELSSHARRLLPTAKIVIITGYNEFEYARKAVELGVAHYLLKPITANEFREMLMKIKKEFDEEFAKRRNLHALRKQVKEHQELLIDRFMVNLISNKMSKEAIASRSEKFNLQLEGNGYQVAVLQLDNMSQIAEIDFEYDYQLLEFAILNICEELLHDHDRCILGNNHQIILLLANRGQTRRSYNQTVEALLNRILIYVKRFYSIDMFIGIGNQYDTLSDLHYSYKDALAALEYRVLVGSGRLIYITDVEKKPSFTYMKVEESLRELEFAIKIGQQDKMTKLLDYIFSTIRFSDVSITDYRTVLLKMTTTIIKVYEDLGEGSAKLVIDFNQFNEVFEKDKLEEVKIYYMTLCHNLSKMIDEDRSDMQSSQVERACDFIHNCYGDKDLDVNKMCEHLGISSSYFSRVFKAATNETFTQYLTKIRMEKAKALLTHSDLKIYEISEKIGYEDPHYFSYNFKKKIGIKPTEYRKREDIS